MVEKSKKLKEQYIKAIGEKDAEITELKKKVEEQAKSLTGIKECYATWSHQMKPRSNSDPAADPRSAAQKLRAVRRCHRKRWPPIEMVPMSAVSVLSDSEIRSGN